MYQALYRKWRPSVFDDVVGQEHITAILRSEIEGGKLSHAYLFCGPRGTGKTTCAKIISKAANCEHPEHGNPCGKCPSCLSISSGTATDVIEMDAASNNGVDNIRDLRDSIVYTPADLKYRVYIIDEVHMLSPSAFNALLKTLEEPPAHVIFILATTELHKIPATVLSRCQRFDFRRVSPGALISRMKTVCAGEGITADDGSLELIARLSQGGMRDALNMLEYCTGGGSEITLERSAELLGASPAEVLSAISRAVAEKDVSSALDVLDGIYHSSRDISVFWRELISFCRDMMLYDATRGTYSCTEAAAATAKLFSVPRLIYILDTFTSAESDMTRLPANAKLYAEMAIVRVCDGTLETGLSSLAARVSQIEENIASGAISAPAKTDKTSDETIPLKKPSAPAKAEKPAEKPALTQKPIQAVRNWIDIIKKVEQKDIGTASFLKGSAAYYGDDGKIRVMCESAFDVLMLTQDDRRSLLAATVSTALGKTFAPEDIVPEEIKSKAVREPIEDLI